MKHASKHTKALTSILHIKYPIIQGPFGGGLSNITLLAAVSNAGGLGSFGAHHLSAEDIITLTQDIRAQTSASFNINLWVSPYDENGKSLNQRAYNDLCKAFHPYYDELGVELPDFPKKLYHSFEEQAEAVIEAKPSVFSFVYGVPSEDILNRCKKHGIITAGAATTVAEAVLLDEAGVDIIVATGFEAGGHRVSFLKKPEDCLMGTLALIPQIVDKVRAPVIAAGGIADARGATAARALGASGIQVGTAFLACNESGTSPEHRDMLFTDAAQETVLTRAYTGRLARFISNKFVKKIAKNSDLPAPFPVQSYFVKALKNEALKSGTTDYMSMYSSQSAPLLKHKKAQDLVKELAHAFSH